jgi:hypothetical protein
MIGSGTPNSQRRTRGMRPLMEGLTGTGVFIGHSLWLFGVGGNLIGA